MRTVGVALLGLALLLAASAEIVELTDDNVGSYVRQSSDLLVIACARNKAPVCNYIESFIPELEDFIEKRIPGLEAGQLELPRSSMAAREFQAKMGEFILFRDGKIHSKHLVADKEKALEWIESHSSRELAEITSKQEFDQLVDNVDHKHATVIVFGGDRDDELHANLLEFSHVFFDSFYVRVVFDDDLIHSILPNPADREKNVWVYRHFGYVEEPDLGFTATANTWEELRHHLMMEGSPLVHKYDNSEVVHMAALTKEAVIIVHMEESDDTTLEMIHHVAAENDNYKRVGIFWHFDDLLTEQLERLDMQEHIGKLPYAVATTRAQRESMRKNVGRLFPIPFFWDTEVELTRQTFTQWVNDILDEKFDFTQISQSEAELAGEDPKGIRRFSRKGLNEFAASSHRDVLVAFVGPVGVCGGECELLLTILAELKETYPYRERLEFGAIDTTRNYVADTGGQFPGMLLVRSNGAEMVPMQNSYRDARAVARWLDAFYKPKQRAHDEF